MTLRSHSDWAHRYFFVSPNERLVFARPSTTDHMRRSFMRTSHLQFGALALVLGTAATTRADVPLSVLEDLGGWTEFNHDFEGTRHNRLETKLTPATVGGLKVKWQ